MTDHGTPDPREANDRRAVLALVAAGAAARLAFAATTGLGVDETYMVALGRRLQLSYLDHPPLAWWIAHFGARLADEADWAVRLPFVALFALSTWLAYRLGARLFGSRAGLIGAAAMNAAPVLGATTATWVLPDGPLDACLLGAALCLARLFFVPGASPALWLLAGLLGGLAMLAKLHGAFLFAGVAVFLLTSPDHRRWLASPWPWAGAIVALATLAPEIVWNAQHDWASLTFQGARAATRAFRPWMPLVALAGQAAFLAPWIWAPLAWATARAALAGPRDPRAWLLVCLGAGPVLFFTLVTIWSDQRPYFHWAAPGYLLLFPLLGRMLAPAFEAGSRRARRWLAGSLAFEAVVAALVALLCLAPGLAGALTSHDPVADLVDWSDAAAVIARDTAPGDVVVARRWYEAARLDHALRGTREVVCLGDDCRGYDFLGGEARLAGRDALIVIPEALPAALDAIAPRFAALAPGPAIVVRHGPFEIARMATWRGRAFAPAGR